MRITAIAWLCALGVMIGFIVYVLKLDYLTFKHILEKDKISSFKIEEPKKYSVRVTGYVPTGNNTAINEEVIVGYTAAVSPRCLELLGHKVYIKNYGVRKINDLTASWLDEKYDMCTIDLAVPTEEHAKQITNSDTELVVLE